ncbi:hypothetical protein [Streptomyces fuscigenes]|uniref:hypothetical protein n=1 Tax=Streptomyces fuscigenes TaxID=1528880 RepID=UPI001F43FD91|nr:hypothetical protein [Streptomyces fuscigenes]MCF3961281.1 hypothetical protein [Streptomyces fuscigenes]
MLVFRRGGLRDQRPGVQGHAPQLTGGQMTTERREIRSFVGSSQCLVEGALEFRTILAQQVRSAVHGASPDAP